MTISEINCNQVDVHGVKSLAKGGKYLTFQLSTEEYGVEILKVREIIGLMKITRIPQSTDCIRGVINLRGKVIPVLDLRRRLNMEVVADTEQTCVIVVDIATPLGKLMMGIVVDAVSEVLDIDARQIEAAPAVGSATDIAFIHGIAKVRNEVKILLDIDRVFDGTALSSVVEAPTATDESGPEEK